MDESCCWDLDFSLTGASSTVNMLRPCAARKFSDYDNQVFISYILSELQHVNRVDVVWDEYLPDSLKAETRSKRGTSNAIPGIWQDFSA